MILMTREERVLEKKVRLSTDGEEHSVIISDKVFSDNTLNTYSHPYRVSIIVPKEKWNRIAVGMKCNLTWELPDV